MYTKSHLMKDLKESGIDPRGVLLVHSSMKSMGEVEGGADTVLDALMEYMTEGLLILPTHSWSEANLKDGIYDPDKEESCVGILTNLFRKRKDVYRSLHPTHSVAAYGKRAKEFIEGEEKMTTPCPREGVWGRLYDWNAQILLMGCPLTSNTFIHGVEEWNEVPMRLDSHTREVGIVKGDEILTIGYRGHKSPKGHVHLNYGKLEEAFLYLDAGRWTAIGDARSFLGEAVKMADITERFLEMDPDLFLDDREIPRRWYMD